MVFWRRRTGWTHAVAGVLLLSLGFGSPGISHAKTELPPLKPPPAYRPASPPQETPAVNAVPLDVLEQHWLGHAEPQRPLPERLATLETLLYGKTFAQQPPSQRLQRLSDSYQRWVAQSAGGTTSGTSSAPSSASTAQPSPPQASSRSASTTAASQTAVAYPQVNQLEQQAFGRTYATEPIEQRLTRLETHAFGAPAPAGASLYDRVERLKALLQPELSPDGGGGLGPAEGATTSRTDPTRPRSEATTVVDGMEEPDDASSSSAADASPDEADSSAVSPQQLEVRLSALEKRLLKNQAAAGTLQQRLERLELAVFKQVADPSIPPEQRLSRLEAVANAPPVRRGSDSPWATAAKVALPLSFLLLLLLAY